MTDTGCILSGGFGHDFDQTSALLADVLHDAGITCEVHDVESGATSLVDRPVNLLVVNALQWRMRAARFDHERAAWGATLSEQAREGIRTHVAGGGAMLAMHTASICFDDWDDWRDLLGGAWNWDRSGHPPLAEVQVEVAATAHPVVAGLADFTLVDEVYGFLDRAPDVEVLLTSSRGGVHHPVLWAHQVDDARVVYDALGHDRRSLSHPVHREIVQRAARWALGDPDARVGGTATGAGPTPGPGAPR